MVGPLKPLHREEDHVPIDGFIRMQKRGNWLFAIGWESEDLLYPRDVLALGQP